MKTSCQQLYDEFINNVIEVLRDIKVTNKKEITKLCLNIVKEMYEQGINIPVTIVLLLNNNGLALYWNKDDRDLQIIITLEGKVRYYLHDWNDNIKNNAFCGEEGLLESTTIVRLTRWLIHGEEIRENYQAIKQVRKSERDSSDA